MTNNYTSLELAKKAHEAGIVVKSEFYWRSDGFEVIPKSQLREDYQAEFPTAPTASEWLEVLPTGTQVVKYEGLDDSISYTATRGSIVEMSQRPQDALALLALELKQQGLLDNK